MYTDQGIQTGILYVQASLEKMEISAFKILRIFLFAGDPSLIPPFGGGGGRPGPSPVPIGGKMAENRATSQRESADYSRVGGLGRGQVRGQYRSQSTERRDVCM